MVKIAFRSSTPWLASCRSTAETRGTQPFLSALFYCTSVPGLNMSGMEKKSFQLNAPPIFIPGTEAQSPDRKSRLRREEQDLHVRTES
jgi:hypothetical protein